MVTETLDNKECVDLTNVSFTWLTDEEIDMAVDLSKFLHGAVADGAHDMLCKGLCADKKDREPTLLKVAGDSHE